MPAAIELREACASTPAGARILGPVSISVAPGEAVAFVGRSGAGKTTALKLMNGLISPSAGEVFMDGASLRTVELPMVRRRTGYILQGVGLFPHRTVYDNIAVVPRLLGWSDAQIRTEGGALLDQLDLPIATYGGRFPRSLSGGEQQRVGIARALISRPAVLLCDEPFAALDPIVRRELQRAVVALRRDRDVTVVFVTHDVREALIVAERVVHFEAGSVITDVPAERYLESEDPLVRRFVESTYG